ncbi:DUF2961 domain-containing protein [bacterium]|nr:MAG: DUF2961 domain-containing protein [bacterium]
MNPLATLLGSGFNGLPLLSPYKTRSISAENPDGAVSGGARADTSHNPACRDLGPGWKAKPAISLHPNAPATIADIEGPGIVQHIWITAPVEANVGTIIRFFWDDEETPSVEVPLGDFFANGHGLRYDVNSMMVAVNPAGGMNCYWPMPFRKRCRIEVESNNPERQDGFFYQITYALGPVADEAAYFHANWRRHVTTRDFPEMTIIDGIKGQGHYVGTHMAWTQMSNGWWGEGELKFFMDGDGEYPTICGTGTEDYFGGAWCFEDRTYSTPFLGYPLCRQVPQEVPRHALYRWHIFDPIRFESDLKVTVQALGWWPNGRYQPLTDDIATVAYWYQTEPHTPFPKLPPLHERWSR